MNELYIQDDKKNKRRAEYVNCEYVNCGKQFLRAINRKKPRRFCSIQCSNAAKRIKIKYFCEYCKKEFERVPSKGTDRTKNGFVFCSVDCFRALFTLGVEESPIIPESWGKTDGRSQNYSRRLSSQIKKKNGCVGCGEKRWYLLTIHHIDGNRSNNIDDNLECVCANCHLIRHLKLVNGEWKYCSSELTPRELLPNFYCFEGSAEPE